MPGSSGSTKAGVRHDGVDGRSTDQSGLSVAVRAARTDVFGGESDRDQGQIHLGLGSPEWPTHTGRTRLFDPQNAQRSAVFKVIQGVVFAKTENPLFSLDDRFASSSSPRPLISAFLSGPSRSS